MDPFLQKHKMDTKHVQQITWQQESSAQDRPLNDVLSIHAYIYMFTNTGENTALQSGKFLKPT